MRRSVVVVAAVLLLAVLVMGCGDSIADPFVGTWQSGPGRNDHFVISRSADTYVVTGFNGAFPNASRRGDELTCWSDLKRNGKPVVQLTFTSTGPDKLVMTDAWGPGVHVPLHRVSSSTVVPSPFYGFDSPAASP